MSVRRLQGVALMFSALSLLIGLLGPQNIGIIGPQAIVVLITMSTILFIVGIPAIYSTQPTGWMGMAGIVLLEFAALIALGFRLNMVPWQGCSARLSLAGSRPENMCFRPGWAGPS
jgi:hypothetical protein